MATPSKPGKLARVKDWYYLQDIAKGDALPEKLTPEEEHVLWDELDKRQHFGRSLVSLTLLALLEHSLTKDVLWKVALLGHAYAHTGIAEALLKQENLGGHARLLAVKVAFETYYEPNELVEVGYVTSEEAVILQAFYSYGLTETVAPCEEYIGLFEKAHSLDEGPREIFLKLVHTTWLDNRAERVKRLHAILEAAHTV